MIEKLNVWLDEHSDEMFDTLKELIAFKSLKAPATEGAPFGAEIRNALDYVLDYGKKHGFNTKDVDGYVGILDFPCEEKEEMMGILCHLDVVPVDDNWISDPFEAVIRDGKIYGRGVEDNKGPAIASIFAMRALKECGVVPTKNIRFIAGCDEESGMTCVKYYTEHEKIPTFSISPDGGYPVINAEKNAYTMLYRSNLKFDVEIDCGTRANIVPSVATALLPFSIEEVNAKAVPLLNETSTQFEIVAEGGKTKLTVFGQSCHASTPQLGKNALQYLIHSLTALNLSANDRAAVDFIYNAFKLEYTGAALGLDKTDKSGTATYNLGVMKLGADGFKLVVDSRIPHCMTKEEIDTAMAPYVTKLEAVLDPRCKIHKGLFIEEDSDFIQTLLGVYREFTGDTAAKPMQIGGGTYARMLPNAVAFGPSFPGAEPVAHIANEYIKVDEFLLNAKILASAMYKLACM